MSPCPYTDAELLRLAVDDHAQTLQALVSCCPECAARADHWRRFATRLRRGLRRAACPSSLTLGELALGSLSAAQRLRVAAHVRTCPECTAEVTLTEQFLSDQRQTWRALPVAPAGLRAAVRGASHPQLFAAGSFRLALECLPVAHDPGRFHVQGMLIGFPPGAWTVTARRERREFTVAVDELDQFTLEDLPAGLYDLIVVSDDVEVIIADIRIEA
jgi:anti-sigma factor RsiW